ncbi:MAG: substrate-binding domain-containing protein [Planctomycetaceae bacterium]
MERHAEAASRRLVVAGCDPAFALLANLDSQRTDFRLMVLPKSCQASLRLLAAGKVHLAGMHLKSAVGGEHNTLTVRKTVGPGHSLVHLDSWRSGLALPLGTRFRRVSQVLHSRQRWVGREPGAGKRQCLDEIRPSGPQPRLIANDHRGVIFAIQPGWADVGIAPRKLCEEGALGFLDVRREISGLCERREDLADPRLSALLRILRSAEFRRLLAELPGYDTTRTGQVRHAS